MYEAAIKIKKQLQLTGTVIYQRLVKDDDSEIDIFYVLFVYDTCTVKKMEVTAPCHSQD